MTGSSAFESLTTNGAVAFPEYASPPSEPMGLLRQWLRDAERQGVREPRALALATADRRGRASNRVVLLTRATGTGLVFTTHTSSRKGLEMAATGWASGMLYWRETGQQVVISGPVATLPEADSDALWAARPVPLHAMTSVSRQSEPLDDVAELREQADRLAALGTPLPRPSRFAGYLLTAAEVEFWAPDPQRLHRRLRYDRTEEGWHVIRLQP